MFFLFFIESALGLARHASLSCDTEVPFRSKACDETVNTVVFALYLFLSAISG